MAGENVVYIHQHLTERQNVSEPAEGKPSGSIEDELSKTFREIEEYFEFNYGKKIPIKGIFTHVRSYKQSNGWEVVEDKTVAMKPEGEPLHPHEYVNCGVVEMDEQSEKFILLSLPGLETKVNWMVPVSKIQVATDEEVRIYNTLFEEQLNK